MKITFAVETAEKEVRECIEAIRERYSIPACIAKGMLTTIVAELQNESKDQLIKEVGTLVAEKDEEIRKAQETAKKILKKEPEEQTDSEELKETE